MLTALAVLPIQTRRSRGSSRRLNRVNVSGVYSSTPNPPEVLWTLSRSVPPLSPLVLGIRPANQRIAIIITAAGTATNRARTQMFTDFVDECRAGSKAGNKGGRGSLMINKSNPAVVDAVKEVAVTA